jgi:hypothetical protein
MDDRGRKTEERRTKTEDRRPKIEDGGSKNGDRYQSIGKTNEKIEDRGEDDAYP